MAENLLSVGLDVGTTSTQLIVSQLTISNRASSFAVPEMEIAERKILYRSPVHFTPLLDQNRVDGDAIGRLVEAEYEKAGIRRQDVDTGAIIITGETSRKENAAAVLKEVSELEADSNLAKLILAMYEKILAGATLKELRLAADAVKAQSLQNVI